MRASERTIELVESYYSHMDAGRFDDCDELFDPDATLRIAHHPEIVGREAIGRVVRAGLSNPLVEAISHDVRNVWEEDDGIVIFEVNAAYELSDGRDVVVPGVVIAEVADGRFLRQRIAADLSPVFGG